MNSCCLRGTSLCETQAPGKSREFIKVLEICFILHNLIEAQSWCYSNWEKIVQGQHEFMQVARVFANLIYCWKVTKQNPLFKLFGCLSATSCSKFGALSVPSSPNARLTAPLAVAATLTAHSHSSHNSWSGTGEATWSWWLNKTRGTLSWYQAGKCKVLSWPLFHLGKSKWLQDVWIKTKYFYVCTT